jgi:hypothetical protein
VDYGREMKIFLSVFVFLSGISVAHSANPVEANSSPRFEQLGAKKAGTIHISKEQMAEADENTIRAFLHSSPEVQRAILKAAAQKKKSTDR